MNKQEKEQKQKCRNYIRNYKKTHCCEKCGDSRSYVLDFHHIDNNKELSLSDISIWDIEVIKREIKKCAVLCSNCHREFHYFERTEGITFKEYLKRE